MTGIPVRVVSEQEFAVWRDDLPSGRDVFPAAVKAKIAETGETLLCWYRPDGSAFQWMCPGCGSTYAGQMGDAPVSGWSSPRWVNSGTREKPTLTPSLACSRWRGGECIGHWWLRDGVLIEA